MICKNCGHLLGDGDKFCPNCGTRAAAESSEVNTRTSMLDDLVSDFNRQTDKQDILGGLSTSFETAPQEEEQKSKHHFQFEEFNWNLDGYPTEETKQTEDIDFNWASVVDEQEKARQAEASVAEPAGAGALAAEPGYTIPSAPGESPISEEEEHEQSLEEVIFGTKDREGNISDTMRVDEAEGLEDLSKTTKMDKFYTYNRKNEEFQELLDKEYNRLRAQIEADAAKDREAEEKVAEEKVAPGVPEVSLEPETPSPVVEEPKAEPQQPEVDPFSAFESMSTQSGSLADLLKAQTENEELSGQNGVASPAVEEEVAESVAPETPAVEIPTQQGISAEAQPEAPAAFTFEEPKAQAAPAPEAPQNAFVSQEPQVQEPVIPQESLFSAPDEKKVENMIHQASPESTWNVPGAEAQVGDGLEIPAFMNSSANTIPLNVVEDLVAGQGVTVTTGASNEAPQYGVPAQETVEAGYVNPAQEQYVAPEAPGQSAFAAPEAAAQNAFVAPETPATEQYQDPAQFYQQAQQFVAQQAQAEPQKPAYEQPQYTAPVAEAPAAETAPAQNAFVAPEVPTQNAFVAPETPVAEQYQDPFTAPEAPATEQFQQQAQEEPEFLGVALSHTPQGYVVEQEDTGVATQSITDNAGYVPPIPQEQAEALGEAGPLEGLQTSQDGSEDSNAQSIEQMIREDEANGKEQLDNRITFQDVFKDEIQAEKEETQEQPKKHTGLKVLAIILCVLIVLEIIVICIKSFAADSAASIALQDIFNAVYGKLSTILGG